MTSLNKRVAIVTGANRGLGFETARQLGQRGLKVIIASRDKEKREKAALVLVREGLDVVTYHLDIAHIESIHELVHKVDHDLGRTDVLVNNAGVLLDARVRKFYDDRDLAPGEASILATKQSMIEDTMTVNLYGPLLLCQLLIPIMQRQDYGRIVNVSTGMAQLSTMSGKWPAYRISKVALNAVTCIFADEVKGQNVLINSVDPGWVKTDLGGPIAPLSPVEAVGTIVWLSTLANDGPSGKFFREHQEIEW